MSKHPLALMMPAGTQAFCAARRDCQRGPEFRAVPRFRGRGIGARRGPEAIFGPSWGNVGRPFRLELGAAMSGYGLNHGGAGLKNTPHAGN
jgi:hypothetical protein